MIKWIPYTSLVPNRPGVDGWAQDYLTLDGHLNALCTVSDSIHLCGLLYWYAYLIIGVLLQVYIMQHAQQLDCPVLRMPQ